MPGDAQRGDAQEDRVKKRAPGSRAERYEIFRAFLIVPRSFWIFSCRRVMA
jgi:hypothetical protein